MKTYQLIGFIGILILITGGFLPLAYLNNDVITIFPLYDNFNLVNSLWVWKDISAFAVTFGITLLIGIYLLFKNLKPGYLIAVSLNLVVMLFIYFSVWLTSVNTHDFNNVLFNYSIFGLLLIIGYVSVFYAGSRIERKGRDN